jgi:hypothetical protein
LVNFYFVDYSVSVREHLEALHKKRFQKITIKINNMQLLQENSTAMIFKSESQSSNQNIFQNSLNSLQNSQYSLENSHNSLPLNQNPGAVSHVLSESEFRNRSKSELKKICRKWTAVTVLEIHLTSLGKSPLYIMVS